MTDGVDDGAGESVGTEEGAGETCCGVPKVGFGVGDLEMVGEEEGDGVG